MILKTVIRCRDKATANEIEQLLRDSATLCQKAVTDGEFVLRVAAEAEKIGDVLSAYSEHLGAAWRRGAIEATDGRVSFQIDGGGR